MKLTTAITVELDGTEIETTIEQLWIDAAFGRITDEKIRCQTPFRPSNSWAGFVTFDALSRPAVYDVGPHIMHTLSGSEAAGPKEAEFFRMIVEMMDTSVDDEVKIGTLDAVLPIWGALLKMQGVKEIVSNTRVEKFLKRYEGLLGSTLPTRRKMINDLLMRGRGLVHMFGAREDCFVPGPPTLNLAGPGNDGVEREDDDTSDAEGPDNTLSLPQWVAEANKQIAQAIFGGKSVVVQPRFDREKRYDVVDFIDVAALKDRLAPERAWVKSGDQIDLVQPFPHWMNDPKRNTCPDVYFKPEATFASDIRRQPLPFNQPINLWRGYQFDPIDPADDSAAAAGAEAMERHILEVWCAGDAVKFKWIMDWLAILIQRPDFVGMPVAVLRSSQGAGKGSIIDNFLVPLFGQSGLVIEKAEQLVGRFNGQLAFNCFTSANEAVWGGDAQKAGAYKALITDENRMVELKFKDAFMAKNYTTLLMSTNENWFAPTNAKDRRHTVFDVSEKYTGNTAYFTNLVDNVVKQRGRQAMLHKLLKRDVDVNSMRRPPSWQSDAAEVNLLNGTDFMYSFFHTVLNGGSFFVPQYDGEPTYSERNDIARRPQLKDILDTDLVRGCRYVWQDGRDVTVLKPDLYHAYLAAHKAAGKRYPSNQAQFWKQVKAIFECGDVRFGATGDRHRAVVLPKLPEARDMFSAHLGRAFKWDAGAVDLDAPILSPLGEPNGIHVTGKSFVDYAPPARGFVEGVKPAHVSRDREDRLLADWERR